MPVLPPDPGPQPLVLSSQPAPGAEPTPSALPFVTATFQSLQTRPGRPRNGKIAHLPAPERDMVNRMLANNLPHIKIVAALDERGFQSH